MINVGSINATEVVGKSSVQSAVSKIENKLGKKGRVLLRPSGTEPVIRVMVEGEDGEIVDKMARELSEVVIDQGAGN